MVKFGFWCEYRDVIGSEGPNSYHGIDHPVEVINIADNDRFDAIIGMDILENFDVTFFKNRECCINLS